MTSKEKSLKRKLFKLDYNCCTQKCKKINPDDVHLLEKARAFINYNMDIHVYLKKLLEIEIIKFCFMNTNERNAVNLLANPGESIQMKEKINSRLAEEYQNINKIQAILELKDEHISSVVETLMKDGRERKVSKRLLRLVSDDALKFR